MKPMNFKTVLASALLSSVACFSIAQGAPAVDAGNTYSPPAAAASARPSAKTARHKAKHKVKHQAMKQKAKKAQKVRHVKQKQQKHNSVHASTGKGPGLQAF
jgi:uncharacterized membrane protein